MFPAENTLIEQLPRKDRLCLLANGERVQLVVAEVLCKRGEITQYVYFPVQGFISLTMKVDNHPSAELAVIGNEGMLGIQLALGVSVVPLQALVQSPGIAWRIEAELFQKELASSIALKRSLYRYVYVLMDQLVVSALCLRFHLIAPRLARWLLMSQDRTHTNSFLVTHEFLASILGVRRVGITIAAGVLQRNGIIEYHRGKLSILDRKALEKVACSCYISSLNSL